MNVLVSVNVVVLVSVIGGCATDQPRRRAAREEPDLPLASRAARDEPSPPSRLRGSTPREEHHEHEPPRRWRGKTIDLDVKEADLHNVFRLLAEVGGVSIVVADDVRGAITLRLRSVPWDQALDTVIRMEKLAVRRDGAVYTITRSSSSSSSSASPSASAPPPPPP